MSASPIHITEQLVYLSLQCIEGQINILYALGPHRDRLQFIKNLEQMTLALAQVIEKNKNDFIEYVEEKSGKMIDESAMVRDILTKTVKATNEPHLREYAKMATTSHQTLVKVLGKVENDITKDILLKFKVMEDDVKMMLSVIESLRRN